MKGRLVLTCTECHLARVARLAVVAVENRAYCAEHAPATPNPRHLRLVPFCGDDIGHGLHDGWVGAH